MINGSLVRLRIGRIAHINGRNAMFDIPLFFIDCLFNYYEEEPAPHRIKYLRSQIENYIKNMFVSQTSGCSPMKAWKALIHSVGAV